MAGSQAPKDAWVPIPTFFSRPDLKSPSLNVSLLDDRASGDFIFTAPFFTQPYRPDSGAYIFDRNGVLIWSGLDAVGAAGKTDVQGLHLCQYRYEDHLCVWQGEQRGMHGSGHGVIVNKHYQIVKTIQAASATSSVDLHEFQLTSMGTALLTIYQPRFFQDMWILDSCFQEVDLEDNGLLFEWCALDHIDLHESHVPAGSFELVGNAKSRHSAWDFFHLNSIDKTADGHFLISARHTDSILKISSSNGTIMWRLNGDKSSFELQNVDFRRQHDARMIRETSLSAIVSVFNNNNDGFTLTDNPSTGLLIHLDFSANKAQKLSEYRLPPSLQAEAYGMGSLQMLPNGHVLLGFGKYSTMVEYLGDGTPVWQAELGWGSLNYRVSKGRWSADPLQPPALWTYSRSRDSAMTFYVSWNGATDVSTWRFYTSDEEHGVYELVGSVEKSSFETNFTHGIPKAWAFAEALGLDGSMRNSSHVRTYVPGLNLASSCGLYHCFPEGNPEDMLLPEDWATATSNVYDHAMSAPSVVNSVLGWTEHGFAVFGLIAAALFIWSWACNRPSPSWRYSRMPIDDNRMVV